MRTRNLLVRLLPVTGLLAFLAVVPTLAAPVQDWRVLGSWRTFASGDDVAAVAQDESGAVWAATAGGVVRWQADGTAARQYLAPQDGLPCNDVRDVVAWRGEWWFATCDGLAVFDPGRDLFEVIQVTLPSPSVSALTVDEGGRLWVASDQHWDASLALPGKKDRGGWTGGGVAWTEDGVNWHVLGVAGGLPSANVRDLAAWRGAVWAATAPYRLWRPPTVDGDGNPVPGRWELLGGGVARRDGETWKTFSSFTSDELSDSAVALAATEQALWVGTGGRGLVAYDGVSWKAHMDCGDDRRCIQDNFVTALAAGPDGAVWVGTARVNGRGTGLQVLDSGRTPTKPGDDAWHAWRTENGLPADLVRAIAPRPDGTVWLGVARIDPEGQRHGRGLARLANDRQSFATWSTSGVGYGTAAGNDITAVARHPVTGAVWVGTNGDGVSVRAPNGQWHAYTVANTAGGLGSDSVADIAIEDTGAVWVATRQTRYDGSVRRWVDGGLSRFDGNAWRRLTAAETGLPSDHLSALALDGRGRLWVGSGATELGPKEFAYRGAGLAVLDTRTLKWERTYQFPTITSNNVTDLYVRGDTLWVATAYFFYVDSRPGGAQLHTGGGVSALNLATHQWRKYGTLEGLTPSLRVRGASGMQPLLDLRSIYVDESDTAWVGGLVYPEGANLAETLPDGVIDTIRPNGITSARFQHAGPVTALAPDANGLLWAATAADGARVRVGENQWLPQVLGDGGLPTGMLSALSLSGGQVWLGTRGQGVIWLAPPGFVDGAVIPPEATPPVVVTRLESQIYLPAVQRQTRPHAVVIPPGVD